METPQEVFGVNVMYYLLFHSLPLPKFFKQLQQIEAEFKIMPQNYKNLSFRTMLIKIQWIGKKKTEENRGGKRKKDGKKNRRKELKRMKG